MDTTKYQVAIYAILDLIAGTILGGLQLHKHDAAAVRFYSDVAAMKDSLVGRHPQDFDLVKVGYITHDNTIEPTHQLILKGSMWLAAQNEVQNEIKLEA